MIDGRDIELYPDISAAALEIEGYEVAVYECLGTDGSEYEAILEGPEWGPVSLRPTGLNRLPHLIGLLRAEADYRALVLPLDLVDEPTAIWAAIVAAEATARGGFTPKVIDLLAEIVACGGEAIDSHLAESCELTKPQLKRQLNWMEKQDLVNQSHDTGGRVWVRATVAGRVALQRARGR